MRIGRFIAAIAVGTVFSTVAATAVSDPAQAQSAACARLQSDLAKARRGSTSRNTRKYNKWNVAAQKQRAALQRANAQARRSGCGRGIFSRSKPVCKGLMNKIGRMKANLRKLEKGRNRFSGGKGNNRSVRRIQARMNRLGCGRRNIRTADRRKNEPIRAGSAKRDRGLLSLLFGGDRRRRSSARVKRVRLQPDDNGRWVPADPDTINRRWNFETGRREGYGEDFGYGGRGFGGGDYRTLCVRTCDGYYFPISFKTTRYNFARDQAMCAAMCPAADVRLYVHRNPGQESEDMVSVNGEPYAALEKAFSYRTSFDPQCTCGRVTASLTTLKVRGDGTGLKEIKLAGDEFDFKKNKGLRKSIPIPEVKLPRDEDPDTIANIRGRFTHTLVTRALELESGQNNPEIAAKKARRVRQVGTSFFSPQ